MSIGERITELRKVKEISQVELAKMLGVSRQAVSKWETDQSSPDTIRLIRLAELLDTEVEYLATGRKPVYQSPPVVVNVVKKVIRVKYLRNPVEFVLCGVVCFLLGLIIGIIL